MNGIISNGMGHPDQRKQGSASAEQQDELPDENVELDENDPDFQQALQFAMNALYQSGAAQNIAQQIRSSQNVSEGIASVAYEIVQITEERTQSIDEELLLLFASYIVEEVVDIASAAGVKVPASAIAEAIKMMTLRWLGESGYDTSELQAAMNRFDARAFDKAADAEASAPGGAADEPEEA